MRFLSIAAWVLTGLFTTGVCFAQEASQHNSAVSHHPSHSVSVKETKKQHTSLKTQKTPHQHSHHSRHHHSQEHAHSQHSKKTHKPPVPARVQPAVAEVSEKPQTAAVLPAPAASAPASVAVQTVNMSTTSVDHRWNHYLAEHHWQNPHLIHRSIVFASNTEHGLVNLVHMAVARLHHTAYRYGGNYFNMSRGVYEVDCSDYVDNLLKISQPQAYADLAGSTHTEKPTSGDYYRFFNNLPDDAGHYWQRVDEVESLKPGDILVFHNYRGGGHVMVVMGTPTPALGEDSTYFVRVSDSASSRHSDDTRPPHASGVGIGTLLLKADPQTGEPSAYAWTIDSGWERSVRVAMAEPVSSV